MKTVRVIVDLQFEDDIPDDTALNIADDWLDSQDIFDSRIDYPIENINAYIQTEVILD